MDGDNKVVTIILCQKKRQPCPKRGKKDGEGSREQVFCEAAEGAGFVYL